MPKTTDPHGAEERRARVLAGLDAPDPSIKWNAGKIVHITQADLCAVLCTLQQERKVYEHTASQLIAAAKDAQAWKARVEAAERDARVLRDLLDMHETVTDECEGIVAERCVPDCLACRIAEARQEEA